MSLQALHDTLDQLEAGLPGDDQENNQRLMGEHLQAVAALSLAVERPSDAAIHALQAHQQRVLARMLELRDEAASHLSQGKRGHRAAKAYLQAESLA